MYWKQLLAACVFTGTAIAVPSVLHETRNGPSPQRRDRVHADAIIPVRIGLRQNNLDSGYDRLLEVSDPASEKYGQHLTQSEVHDLFAPAEPTVEAVKAWLLQAGIEANSIVHYDNKGWLAVDMPAGKAERLLSTEYYEHHDDSGSVRIGCNAYYLPEHISQHVDFIKPGVKLSSPLKKRSSSIAERSFRPGHGGKWPKIPHLPDFPFPNWFPLNGVPADLQGCNRNITPACIKALYDLPQRNRLSNPLNVMGLYETYDAFSNEDIQLFFKTFAPYVPQGTTPTVLSVDGGTAPVPPGDDRNTGESIIDIDLAQSLIFPQKIIVYQVDDIPNASGETGDAGFLNTWLDSVDGSYCGYSSNGITGDSPGIDAQYPDTSGLPGAYTGARQCGVYNLTRVVSISYGEPEDDLPKAYVQRQCNEFMKLGLQGHSVFVASGDYGVASYTGADGDEYGCLSGPGQNGTIYNPDYPVGCPYVTAVGATRLYRNDTVYDPESAMQVNLSDPSDPSTAPLALFASGGGFSNYFPVAKYQSSAISSYLSKHATKIPSYAVNSDASNIGEDGGVYNRLGRGYPDVSANGAGFQAYINQTLYYNFGTSLSSPLFGSVINLINEERTAIGKGPVGFVNPVLYAHSEVLNDITNGSNPNCGSAGFSAAKGWDPVTGLGTPNYPKMLALFLSLP